MIKKNASKPWPKHVNWASIGLWKAEVPLAQCCGSEIIFFGFGSYLDLNRIRLVYEKYIRNSDYLGIAKKPDCLEKFI